MRPTISKIGWFALKLFVACVAVIWLAIVSLRVSSSEKVLSRIQEIHQGDTREKVKKVMGGEPVIFKASALPEWMKKVVSEKPLGEYWTYGIGPYPPRVLIIYFENGEEVAYVTWTDS